MKFQLKHKKNLKVILMIAFLLSILGFIMDLNELEPSLFQNLKDISLMTVLLFGIGLAIYLFLVVIIILIPRKT